MSDVPNSVVSDYPATSDIEQKRLETLKMDPGRKELGNLIIGAVFDPDDREKLPSNVKGLFERYPEERVSMLKDLGFMSSLRSLADEIRENYGLNEQNTTQE